MPKENEMTTASASIADPTPLESFPCGRCGQTCVACFAGPDRPRDPADGSYYVHFSCLACDPNASPIPAGFFDDIRNIAPDKESLIRYLELGARILRSPVGEATEREQVRLLRSYCTAYLLRKKAEDGSGK